jgi:hypothetical protein
MTIPTSISEVIEELKEIKEKHGDLGCVGMYFDSRWGEMREKTLDIKLINNKGATPSVQIH